MRPGTIQAYSIIAVIVLAGGILSFLMPVSLQGCLFGEVLLLAGMMIYARRNF